MGWVVGSRWGRCWRRWTTSGSHERRASTRHVRSWVAIGGGLSGGDQVADDLLAERGADGFGVVSVTQIRAGTATNIIPARVEFGGTVRTLRDETRAMAKRRLYAIVESTAAAYGCAAEIDWREGYPVTHNEPATTERFFRVARAAVGEARVATVPTPTLGGEDFSYYGHHVPACFFILGVKPALRQWPSLHSRVRLQRRWLETGIELMVRLALDAE